MNLYDINKIKSNEIIDNHTQLRKTSVVTRQSRSMFNFNFILCFILLLFFLLISETNGCWRMITGGMFGRNLYESRTLTKLKAIK